MAAAIDPIIGRYLHLTVGGTRTESISRKPAKEFRCCACTPPAPMAGSSAISWSIAR